MFLVSVGLFGAAVMQGAGDIGIGMLFVGVLSFGVMYSPWFFTSDHDSPTPTLLMFAVIVWFCIIFAALYGLMVDYDMYTLYGFGVLALPAYRTVRSTIKSPKMLYPF